MADRFDLIPNPITIDAGATIRMAIEFARDTTPYDTLDLHLGVLKAGPFLAGKNLIVRILTSTQAEVDDSSWLSIGEFSVAETGWFMRRFGTVTISQPLLSSARYEIVNEGTGPATIVLRGLARRLGGY